MQVKKKKNHLPAETDACKQSLPNNLNFNPFQTSPGFYVSAVHIF